MIVRRVRRGRWRGRLVLLAWGSSTETTRRPGALMNGQPDRRGRERLLAVTVDELVRGGSRGRSLRGLAADVATSHRMLLYHFGSRQGVLEASMAALAAAQQALVADILNRCGAPEDCLRDLFGLLLDPQHGPGRMFLERPDVDASRGGVPGRG